MRASSQASAVHSPAHRSQAGARQVKLYGLEVIPSVPAPGARAVAHPPPLLIVPADSKPSERESGCKEGPSQPTWSGVT